MTQAQTVTTTVETTKITSEASTPESLEQLVTAIRAYDGLVINFEGELLWNSISEDEWLLIVDDGLAITLELDDGRATTQQAQKCPSKFTNAGSGCKVQVDVELQTASSHRLYDAHISIKGVGFNVKFLE
jgi:hypothetical protein